jgi:S-DNA-T family DNA segregation ATPase FtsK/SpoIIIE
VQDPSFNHATDAAVKNWLGRPGAIVADSLMQSVGIAALAVVLPAAVWGWQFLTHRATSRLKVRLAGWVLGAVFSAGFVASLPASENWPLPAGLGGVLGDALMRIPAFVIGDALAIEVKMFVGLFYGALAALALAAACGLGASSAEEDAVDADRPGRTVVSLGALAHGILAL